MLPAVVDPSEQYFCDRAVDGIAAVFLALKRRPVIRYQRTSDIAKRIAQDAAVSKLWWKTWWVFYSFDCYRYNLLDFHTFKWQSSFLICGVESFYLLTCKTLRTGTSVSHWINNNCRNLCTSKKVVFLISDEQKSLHCCWLLIGGMILLLLCWINGHIRCFDHSFATQFVTINWNREHSIVLMILYIDMILLVNEIDTSYFFWQAMVHELIGIQDNKVDLRNISKVPKDQQVALYICNLVLLVIAFYE